MKKTDKKHITGKSIFRSTYSKQIIDINSPDRSPIKTLTFEGAITFQNKKGRITLLLLQLIIVTAAVDEATKKKISSPRILKNQQNKF